MSGCLQRLRRDDGMALPVVILAITAAFALASAAVVASVGSQRGTVRDQESKAAFAAAEAGLNEALFRYNGFRETNVVKCLSQATPEAQVTVTQPQTTGTDAGWCVPVGPRALAGVDGGTFTYWVKPTATDLEIVSQGSVDGITRRVNVAAKSALYPFKTTSVVSDQDITIASNATIDANVATNGSIIMDANSNLICDLVQVGVGEGVETPVGGATFNYNCPQPVEDQISLPPVSQGNVATVNDNGSWTTSGNAPATWNPSSRQLTIASNTTLTLTGNRYSFCRLSLGQNSNLYVQAGTKVWIYFDKVQNCPGLPNPADQLDMSQNSRIGSTGDDSQPNQIQMALLFVGTDDPEGWPSVINLQSNTTNDQECAQDFVVYAPLSIINFASNAVYCGATAGLEVNLASFANVSSSNFASEFTLPGDVPFEITEFRECDVDAASPPDGGC